MKNGYELIPQPNKIANDAVVHGGSPRKGGGFLYFAACNWWYHVRKNPALVTTFLSKKRPPSSGYHVSKNSVDALCCSPVFFAWFSNPAEIFSAKNSLCLTLSFVKNRFLRAILMAKIAFYIYRVYQ